MDEHDTDTNHVSDHLTRMVDLRLPLHWLITGLVAGLWVLISMWFSLSQLVKTVSDLQITLAASNSSVAVVLQEVNMLKYRQTTTESEIARINEALRSKK